MTTIGTKRCARASRNRAYGDSPDDSPDGGSGCERTRPSWLTKTDTIVTK
jgi:hypothetical protein